MHQRNDATTKNIGDNSTNVKFNLIISAQRLIRLKLVTMNAQKLDKNECYINRFSCYTRPNLLMQNRIPHMCVPFPLFVLFLFVITSLNLIKILFGIRFVFATKSSVSPLLRLLRLRETRKTICEWLVSWKSKCENAFSLLSSLVPLFTFRYLGFWQINDTNFSYIIYLDGIACMRACACVCVCVFYSLDLLFLFTFTVNFTIESILSDKMANQTIH